MARSLIGCIDGQVDYRCGVTDQLRKHGFPGSGGFCFEGLVVQKEVGEVKAHEKELCAWLYCIVSIINLVDLTGCDIHKINCHSFFQSCK